MKFRVLHGVAGALLALIVAVAALTGVGFLVDRIERSVALRANEVLAADLRIESQNPPANDYELEAQRRGLVTARNTTIFEGTDESLNKKAVDNLLSKDLPDNVRTVLEIRKEGGKSSVAKYQAMTDRVSSDGRVRGNLIGHDAILDIFFVRQPQMFLGCDVKIGRAHV